jgi:hypothetical protein
MKHMVITQTKQHSNTILSEEVVEKRGKVRGLRTFRSEQRILVEDKCHETKYDNVIQKQLIFHRIITSNYSVKASACMEQKLAVQATLINDP